jgi:hypothetical protein
MELDVTVTIEGKEIEVSDLLAIDETDLSAEYAAQAARYAYVAVLAAKAKEQWAETERARKEDEAKAFEEYKNASDRIPEGSKYITDGYASQLVQADEVVNQHKKDENAAEYNYRLLLALSDALSMRASMLISLGADQRQEYNQTDMHLNDNLGERTKSALIARHNRSNK